MLYWLHRNDVTNWAWENERTGLNASTFSPEIVWETGWYIKNTSFYGATGCETTRHIHSVSPPILLFNDPNVHTQRQKNDNNSSNVFPPHFTQTSYTLCCAYSLAKKNPEQISPSSLISWYSHYFNI